MRLQWSVYIDVVHLASIDTEISCRARATDAEVECLLNACEIMASGSTFVVQPEEFLRIVLGDDHAAKQVATRNGQLTPHPPSKAQNHPPRKAWVQTQPDEQKKPTEQKDAVHSQAQLNTVDWSSVPLPKGWERRMTDEGREYYLDHRNRTTQWYHPNDPRAQQAKRKKKKQSTL